MMRLRFKKQICMGGGCMFNSGDLLLGVLYLLGGLFSLMMSFYILLCFIQWIADVIEEKRWLVWMEWFRYDG